MSVRAVVRSSDDIFRMPSIEAHATPSNCYEHCCWYYCSYAMCVGQHGWHQSWAAPSCYFPSQPTSVVLWGKQAQFLKSAEEARSPDMESVERREQMAFGALCWGISVSYSMGPWGVREHNGSMCTACDAVTGKASRPHSLGETA